MSGPGPTPDGRIHLRLYIAGTSPRSVRTVESVRRLCDGRLNGCELEVVDLYQQPGLAGADGVVAAPTLVRLSPPPARRIAGDLTDERRVLEALGLRAPALPPGAGAQESGSAQGLEGLAEGIGGADAR